jgi:AbrB family looped-hinge helix DNA binding protein
MSVATVGARYQIVIPLKERKHVGLKPNQKVQVSVEEDRIILEPIGNQQLRGLLSELRDKNDATSYVRKLRQEWKIRS